MAAEQALKRMQDELGLETGTDLFGNALENEDFMRFVANYVTSKKNELQKDASYLRATVGRKTSQQMATRYGVDIKDPNALKLARAEVAKQIEQWRSPYTNSELMNEIRDAWAAKTPNEPMVNFSVETTQQAVVERLRSNQETRVFVEGVDAVEKMKTLRNISDETIQYMDVSKDMVKDILSLSDGKINLSDKKHSFRYDAIWHAYRHHCLDSFVGDNQLNITFDDIRMTPDVLNGYDKLKLVPMKGGGYTLQATKEYGGYNLTAVITMPVKKGNNQSALITNWLKEKNAPAGTVSPHIQAQGFERTAIVTPLETLVKQNYSNEAKDIAQKSYLNNDALSTSSKKRSNLTPTQWLAVRLNSFSEYFGDWRNSPETASKVVDENGEPLVMHHGTNQAWNLGCQGAAWNLGCQGAERTWNLGCQGAERTYFQHVIC